MATAEREREKGKAATCESSPQQPGGKGRLSSKSPQANPSTEGADAPSHSQGLRAAVFPRGIVKSWLFGGRPHLSYQVNSPVLLSACHGEERKKATAVVEPGKCTPDLSASSFKKMNAAVSLGVIIPPS
ncbi:hypothetical protein COCON_G00148760 [Conger conger]|uniref:Uncharacterized protein n=1 Tax=Conger conger TaxID=82655 RepID=A0A9Q1DC47_CONCO|nr:hypothetical protein COCON_G00148760 [Conger conger]